MVTSTLYFDALIVEFFKICLAMGQTPGEGTHSKVFFEVSMVRRGNFLAWGPG